MIETAQALDNLDAILSVEGLDAIYIGPSDLSLALGCKPVFDDLDPKARRPSTTSWRAPGARRGGRHPQRPARRGGARIAKGFQFVTVSSDARLMAAGAQQVMADARRPAAQARQRLLIRTRTPHEHRIHRPGHHGRAHGPAPAQRRPHTLRAPRAGVCPRRWRHPRRLVCANAAEVARQAEVIFLMVPDTPDVEAVLFGPGGVAQGCRPQRRPQGRGRHEQHLADGHQGLRRSASTRWAADYIDAPVSGGEVGAKAASLTIMCGGDAAVFERVLPLLQLMGKNITLVGGNGDGQTTKVANQIIVALNIAAVGEALLFASKAGADPGQGAPGADGRLCSQPHPGSAWRTHDQAHVRPGFRIKLHQKDLNLALQGARELGVACRRRPAPRS
jgi:3-hydroxyisobutyrate dehydrogenase-like beta-hydroxyacid dehydrogenase